MVRNPDKDKDIIISRLKQQGCRITKQRLMLLDVILEEDCSSCKEIYYKAIKKDPKIGAATVYRMVNKLAEIGAINRKNMYRITCDENDNGGYTVRLNDDSSINLSESKWSKIIESGLEACGYIKNQKITSVVDRKKSVSGLGKGITAASLGRLLKARGFSVTMQKFDPYINIDPGTMNPIQHGEVFVTDDGAETDLDLGHYERFIDENLNKNSNVTTGKVYWSVLQKERRGDFGGGTVQVIPHITNEIKSRFFRDFSTKDTKIAIIEVGGTVGDIESQPFLEAIRQFQHEVGRENAILIHVTLIPYLKASGEMKTKPTQASVKELQGMGIQPDILVCRTEHPLEPGIKDKIALFCNVPKSHVLQNLDVEILYDAPLAMEEEHLAQVACECLQLECPEPDLDEWRAMCKAWKNPQKKVTVALVGKYIQLHDAYISVVEALKHGGVYNSADVTIKWVDSELVTGRKRSRSAYSSKRNDSLTE